MYVYMKIAIISKFGHFECLFYLGKWRLEK